MTAGEAGAVARHRVIIYPPTPTGGRRVRVDGTILGTAAVCTVSVCSSAARDQRPYRGGSGGRDSRIRSPAPAR
ncbi:hypothetical protein E4K10_44530 [Streptomyces sp. T1317-0309]|nr:hypothetical protein E4K10_44530 [Streptomyces sp. T1317-0309]